MNCDYKNLLIYNMLAKTVIFKLQLNKFFQYQNSAAFQCLKIYKSGFLQTCDLVLYLLMMTLELSKSNNFILEHTAQWSLIYQVILRIGQK